MPRLAVIDPAKSQGKAKEVFEGPLKGKHLNIFKSMANSPAALQYYLAGCGALRDAMLSAAEQETIALALSEVNGCQYCLAAHTGLGKQAGLTPDQMIGARRGQVSDAKLNALTAFTRSLTEKRGYVSDEDLAAVRQAGYNDGHIAEAIAVYVHTLYTNYFNHVNRTEVDLPAAPPLR